MPSTIAVDAADSLSAEGLEASAWSNGPGDTYAAHRHAYDKVLVATSGAITFELPERGRSVLLASGDRLDLPAATLHAAVVSTEGVTCLEAHLPAGALEAGLRHRAGWTADAKTAPRSTT